MRILILLFLPLFFLFSCASKPGDKSFEPSNKKEQIEHLIKISPDWFFEVNRSSNFIYGSATASSDEYQISIKKATLLAKAELANKISGQISESEEFSNKEGLIDNKIQKSDNYSNVVQNKTIDQIVSNYNIDQIKTIADGKKFRTFILLKKQKD